MWSRAVLLLLCLPVCSSHHHMYQDQDDGLQEYSDAYDNYEEGVVTMPALATTTLYRKYVDVDIRKLLISPDPDWPGFRYWPVNGTLAPDPDWPGFPYWPVNGTLASESSNTEEKWRSFPVMIIKPELTPATVTEHTRIRRDHENSEVGPVENVIDDGVNNYIQRLQNDTTLYKREGRTGLTSTTTTEGWFTYAEGVRTYWANNRPRTYPKQILINGTWHMLPPDWPFHTTINHTCPTKPTTTTTTTTTTPKPTLRLDIVGLLDLIANLTYEYDMNLTERFNETLIKYSVPTCPTPTTTITPSPTTPVYDFANTTIVGKCFVCGLEKEEIPQDAYCADAFAGDFLPLVPIDPRARGQIARYRKYCRFLDVRQYELNEDEPRAVYGRFTGGCSVRWTDLSGVYTQRTCRNKRRAVLGKHFASKRMAKLEMALNHLDNGCIISPMATLLPLSRGVSLYARFHACVCTGAWCNRSIQNEPWMVNILLPIWFYTYR